MPGVFGFTNNTKESVNRNISLNNLFNKIHDFHRKHDFINEYITNVIVGFDFTENYKFHYQIESLEIWIYGDPLIDGYTGNKALEKITDMLFNSLPHFSSVALIDGLFTIVVLDKSKQKLYIIGDRNGLSHVYYGVFNGQLIWGSELRFFLNQNIKTTIRRQSITTFLDLGYLIGDTTWFNEIQLLSPASFLEWDLSKGQLDGINEYWSHKSLDSKRDIKDEDKIVKDLADLFSQAVKKRVGDEERVGITLSGGLDSRAIFANIPKRNQEFIAITRGIKDCGDIKIASKVAKSVRIASMYYGI